MMLRSVSELVQGNLYSVAHWRAFSVSNSRVHIKEGTTFIFHSCSIEKLEFLKNTEFCTMLVINMSTGLDE
jgi:hypothetical protein